MPTYALYLESGPRKKTTMVHVPELLGCIARGPTTEDALDATPDAIRAFLRFLQARGESVDPKADFALNVAEHITEGYFLGNGSPSILFQSDLPPVSKSELETWVRRLGWFRAAILELVAHLSPDVILATPEIGGRSVSDILGHVLGAQNAYLGTIGTPKSLNRLRAQADKGDGDTRDLLRESGPILFERLSALTPDERARTVQRGQEKLTARKMFRRLLEHEWEHYLELQTRLGPNR